MHGFDRPGPAGGTVLAAACAAILSACAAPDYSPPLDPVSAEFARIDADGDGFLSRTEASALQNVSLDPRVTAAAFDEHDLNRDGYLSRMEAAPLLRSRIERPVR